MTKNHKALVRVHVSTKLFIWILLCTSSFMLSGEDVTVQQEGENDERGCVHHGQEREELPICDYKIGCWGDPAFSAAPSCRLCFRRLPFGRLMVIGRAVEGPFFIIKTKGLSTFTAVTHQSGVGTFSFIMTLSVQCSVV